MIDAATLRAVARGMLSDAPGGPRRSHQLEKLAEAVDLNPFAGWGEAKVRFVGSDLFVVAPQGLATTMVSLSQEGAVYRVFPYGTSPGEDVDVYVDVPVTWE